MRLLLVLTAVLLLMGGGARAGYEDGLAALERGDLAAAFEEFRALAESGHREAQFSLAFMYDFGQGVAQDSAKALEWYRSAADQGLEEAQLALALMYADGRGVERDPATAATWYRRAALQGNLLAQNDLAGLYREGKGVEQDLVEAFVWYDVAARGLPEGDARRSVVESRDAVAAALDEQQLADANQRAAAFLATPELPPARPAAQAREAPEEAAPAPGAPEAEAPEAGAPETEAPETMVMQEATAPAEPPAAPASRAADAAPAGPNPEASEPPEPMAEVGAEAAPETAGADAAPAEAGTNSAPDTAGVDSAPAEVAAVPPPETEPAVPPPAPTPETGAGTGSETGAGQDWWRLEPSARSQVQRVQLLLADLGYRPGPADGKPGGRTRAAIEAFETDQGWPLTGEITDRLEETLGRVLEGRRQAGFAVGSRSAAPAPGGGAAPGGDIDAIIENVLTGRGAPAAIQGAPEPPAAAAPSARQTAAAPTATQLGAASGGIAAVIEERLTSLDAVVESVQSVSAAGLGWNLVEAWEDETGRRFSRVLGAAAVAELTGELRARRQSQIILGDPYGNFLRVTTAYKDYLSALKTRFE